MSSQSQQDFLLSFVFSTRKPRAVLVSLGSPNCSSSLFLPQFLSENRFTLFRNSLYL